jgi:predicted transcriptional regulator
MEPSVQIIYDSLRVSYNKQVLSKQELAKELGIGLSTVSKYLAEGIGLPNYKKLGTAQNSRIIFPMKDVAEFLDQTTKVA